MKRDPSQLSDAGKAMLQQVLETEQQIQRAIGDRQTEIAELRDLLHRFDHGTDVGDAATLAADVTALCADLDAAPIAAIKKFYAARGVIVPVE